MKKLLGLLLIFAIILSGCSQKTIKLNGYNDQQMVNDSYQAYKIIYKCLKDNVAPTDKENKILIEYSNKYMGDNSNFLQRPENEYNMILNINEASGLLDNYFNAKEQGLENETQAKQDRALGVQICQEYKSIFGD